MRTNREYSLKVVVEAIVQDLMGNCGGKLARPKVQDSPEPAVGVQLLQNSEVDAADVPEERAPMVVMEILAGRKTQYRRREQTYRSSGSLDYSQDSELYAIRNLLDEPVGRYYAREYCTSKNLEAERVLVDFWIHTHLLQRPEVSLHQVLRSKTITSMDSISIDERTEESMNQGNERNEGDEPIDDKARLLQAARQIVESFLNEDSELKLYSTEIEASLIEKTRSSAEEAIAEENLEALRSDVFAESGEEAILLLAKLEFHSKFRKHSEFKRYGTKFRNVYNSISHKDFDYLRILGRGSFGKVIHVRAKVTKKHYALKVIAKRKLIENSESTSQVTIERNVLLTCDHPNIVKMYVCFQTSRALFLVLECLQGGTLAQAAHDCGGTLSVDAVRFLGAQVILALDHLHTQGVVYRDLKPENVMLDSHGNAILTDMGLCVKFRQSKIPGKTSATDMMPIVKPEELRCAGTINFRAPEVLKSKSTKKGYGAEADYFSLGVTLFLLISGAMPYKPKPLWPIASFLFGKDMKAEEIANQNNPPKYNDIFEDKDLISCLKGLLTLDANSRLGRDVDELKRHSFFNVISWSELESGKSSPVYVPKVKDHAPDQKPKYSDLHHVLSCFPFDNMLEAFAGEVEGKTDFQHVRSKHQKLFRNWEYVADDVLEEIWHKVETEEDDTSPPTDQTPPAEPCPETC